MPVDFRDRRPGRGLRPLHRGRRPGAELEVCEVGDDNCCESAGVYNILEPDAATELGERKAAAMRATGAEVVVSTNPGCLMQIKASMRSAGCEVPTMHVAEVLDLSTRGLRLGPGERGGENPDRRVSSSELTPKERRSVTGTS